MPEVKKGMYSDFIVLCMALSRQVSHGSEL